jgi:hypothetical protein
MKQKLRIRRIRKHPDLEQLKRQAKELLTDERVSGCEGDWVAYSQGYPLWNAAAMGLSEIANLLLDRGANPNVHFDSSG